ncbi:hypothetical protein KY285_010330 [Solanum tuberosum]|nr:hypothetical protein KY289_010883 [Solanum tuberosum]KAH0734623.1 hypothetical protein KY285_010330 [Solanum tuberosum]
MFLNILAHHEKNRSIKVDYIRFGWSISQDFNECLRAILKLTPLLLVDPKPVSEDEIEDRWKWFKDFLGALDGSAVDGRVLRDVVVQHNGLKIPEGNYYLCDGGYMNGKGFLSPYRGAFGLLEGRWGILRSSSWYSVKVHNKTISACCSINNYIYREMDVDHLDMDMEEPMENQTELTDVESSEK